MVPPKSHVSSPLSNQLATIHSLFNSAQTQTLLQSHSQGTSGTTTTSSGGNSSSAVRSSIGDMSGRNNAIHGNKGNTNNSSGKRNRFWLYLVRFSDCFCFVFLQMLCHYWKLKTFWSRMATWRRRRLYLRKAFCRTTSTTTDSS